MDNQDKQYIKLPKWIIIILGLSLLLNVVIIYDLKFMKQELLNLRYNVSHIESSVSNTVSSSISRINYLLEKEASLISEFKHEFGEYSNKRIDVVLEVKPKSLTKEDKIYFSYSTEEDDPVLVQAETHDNITFTTKANMSIYHDLEIDLITDNGTTQRVEKLGTIRRPVDEFTSRLGPVTRGGSIRYDKNKKGIVTSHDFEIMDHWKQTDNKLSDVKLIITVNDEVVKEESMEKMDLDEYADRYYLRLTNYLIPCEETDTVKLYITAKDDRGLNYRYTIDTIQGSREDFHTPFGKVEVY